MFTIDSAKYFLFLGTTFIICIVPGPDMLYILAASIRSGTKFGIAAAFGMSIGMLLYTIAVSVGISAFFSISNRIFYMLQICGGIYLIWIGIQTLNDMRNATRLVSCKKQEPLLLTFKQAVLTNLMNPKVAVFYMAYLPQFTNKSLGHMTNQLLILGFSFLILGLAVDSVIGILSGHIRSILMNNSKFIKILKVFSVVIYFGLGIHMFFNA